MQARIQNIYQVTRSMDRSLAFYRDVLGMQLKFQDGDNWAQLDAQGAKFALGSPEEAGTGVDGGTVVVFEVADLAAALKALEAQGCPILASRDMGSHGSTLTSRDPDGNVFQLFSREVSQ